MPFRLSEERSKIQFTSSAGMPYLVYQACLATGVPSNTVYYQHAVCEKLSRDLKIPLEKLLADLPQTRGPGKHLFSKDGDPLPQHQLHGIGPANTVEEVR